MRAVRAVAKGRGGKAAIGGGGGGGGGEGGGGVGMHWQPLNTLYTMQAIASNR